MSNKVDLDYPLEWEKYLEKGYEKPENWMRSTREISSSHVDRSWMYRNMTKPVLDVGCGTCIDAAGFGEGYVGLDITPSFLYAARFVYGVHNLVLADGRCLPFRDKSFKTTYARALLVHYLLDDTLRFIEELCRAGETSYVVWSKKYMPSDETTTRQNKFGFWWFTPNFVDLEERFQLGPPKGNTSITEVNLR